MEEVVSVEPAAVQAQAAPPTEVEPLPVETETLEEQPPEEVIEEQPQEVAEAVRWLLQDASYSTGQVLHLDGGRLLGA